MLIMSGNFSKNIGFLVMEKELQYDTKGLELSF